MDKVGWRRAWGRQGCSGTKCLRYRIATLFMKSKKKINRKPTKPDRMNSTIQDGREWGDARVKEKKKTSCAGLKKRYPGCTNMKEMGCVVIPEEVRRGYYRVQSLQCLRKEITIAHEERREWNQEMAWNSAEKKKEEKGTKKRAKLPIRPKILRGSTRVETWGGRASKIHVSIGLHAGRWERGRRKETRGGKRVRVCKKAGRELVNGKGKTKVGRNHETELKRRNKNGMHRAVLKRETWSEKVRGARRVPDSQQRNKMGNSGKMGSKERVVAEP